MPFNELLEYLRTIKYGIDKLVLLRAPDGHFLEIDKDHYNKAIDELERLSWFEEPASPLQKIGIYMLLGWDYDYLYKRPEDATGV